jgi:hypothetical protein
VSSEQILSRCAQLTAAVNSADEVDTTDLDDLAATIHRLAPSWNKRQLEPVMQAFSKLIDAVTTRRDAVHLEIATTATGSKAVRGYGRPNSRLYTGQRISRDI